MNQLLVYHRNIPDIDYQVRIDPDIDTINFLSYFSEAGIKSFVFNFIIMENKLFKKLNFKNQSEILVLNHPESFTKELRAIDPVTTVATDIENIAGTSVDFAMAFGTTVDHVNTLTRAIAPILGSDAVFWFCYPKKSSKKYLSA